MEETIKTIENAMMRGDLALAPSLAADFRARLAGEYSFYMSQLQEIESKRPATWTNMRPIYKSDLACTRAWEMTKDGIEHNWLEKRLKRIDKLMSGLKSLLDNASNEARNMN